MATKTMIIMNSRTMMDRAGNIYRRDLSPTETKLPPSYDEVRDNFIIQKQPQALLFCDQAPMQETVVPVAVPGVPTKRKALKKRDKTKTTKTTKTTVPAIRKQIFKRVFYGDMVKEGYSHLTAKRLEMLSRYRVIYGAPQLGKTTMMLSIALKRMPQFSIILLANTNDQKIQLASNIEAMVKEFADWLRNSGVRDIPYTFEALTVAQLNQAKVDEAFSGSPKIIVALANASQMRKLNMLIPGTDRPFTLFIDEADMLDSKYNATTIELGSLKTKAEQVIAVTATPMDPCLQHDIHPSQLFILKPPKNYTGLFHYRWNLFEHNSKFTTKIDEDMLKNDPNLLVFLKLIAKKKPVPQACYGESHPVSVLIRGARTIEPQKKFFKHVVNKYPSFATILYIGEGVYIHHRALGTDPITINGVTSTVDRKRTIHTIHMLKGVGIAEVYTYLKYNGGCTVFPRIVTIAGDLARRGISFVSNDYEQCAGKKSLRWHLTDLYVVVASSTDQAELVQILGRMAGNFPDNTTRTVHTTTEIANAVIKAGRLIDEKVTGFAAGIGDEDGDEHEKFFSYLTKRLTNVNKVVKGRKLTKNTKVKLALTRGDDGGIPLTEYQVPEERTTRVIDGLQTGIEAEAVNMVGEAANVERDEVEPGMCLLIVRNNLLPSQQRYYDQIINYIQNCSGGWVARSKVINGIKGSEPINSVRRALTMMCQDRGTSCGAAQQGLLFRKMNNEWGIRVN